MQLHVFLSLLFGLSHKCACLLAKKLRESGSQTLLEMMINIKGDRFGPGARPVQDWINHTDTQVGKATKKKASELISLLPKYMEDRPGVSQEVAMKMLLHQEVSCQMSTRTFVTITNGDAHMCCDGGLLVSAASAVSSESEPSDLDPDSDSDDGFVVIEQKNQEDDEEYEDDDVVIGKKNKEDDEEDEDDEE